MNHQISGEKEEIIVNREERATDGGNRSRSKIEGDGLGREKSERNKP